MQLFRFKPGSLGIASRIALLSWLVALATLLVFASATVSRQKRVFLDHLESKANGVAVSLHEVAAGAAVNEDFASVVGAGQTMIEGDPDLDFLIVMKNDGFSLIMERGSWRAEPESDPCWRPEIRESVGAIERVPLLDRRVFHFAQPFDYSGIQWGWIHVGLSLDRYDRSVAALHRNTALLGFGCMAFSLLGSLVYARRLVRPILRLRHLVERIAGGDLSVRADRVGHDELGSLALSVNTMAEALLRRDRILESVRFAAQQFLRSPEWEQAIDAVLAKIGQAADVSRAYIFENQTDAAGRLCTASRYEWVAENVSPQLDNPEIQQLPYDAAGFGRWRESLGKNEIISGPVSAMSAEERTILEPQGIVSIIVIPVFVEGRWWGFMGFDDCLRERVWTDAEKDSLRAGADMFGATIARQNIQQALLEAKATLEQRVEARTRELQTQVAAKETALAELAAAQSSLLEASRIAGRSEVATGVLHNVGNVLNSVNVSCTLLMDQLRQSRVGNVARVAGLMAEAGGGLARFLAEDERGRQIPAYLESLAAALQEEQRTLFTEAEALHGRIGHIKEIVAMQQSYGRLSGVRETIAAEQLMEDALKLNAGALARHGIAVERRYEPVPSITVDKHAVLQILLNLINNAKHACAEGGKAEKNIRVSVSGDGPDRVRMQVADNGTGIAPENMTRIFQHGFTTRRDGHGFGLHSGAIAARDLGGSLSAGSDGPGRGATFTLDLPRDKETGHGRQ